MNITLLNGSVIVWQGTLEDFINAGNISLINLGGGDSQTLLVKADMAGSIPNDLQGKSSVFNFSFGFVGENKGDENSSESSSSSSNSDNSNSSDSPSLTEEPV